MTRADTPAGIGGRRIGLLLFSSLLTFAVLGCSQSSDDAEGGTADQACAFRLEFRDSVYTDLANIKFTPGPRLGRAHELNCNDGPGEESSDGLVDTQQPTVYAVSGLDSELAIAVGDDPKNLTFLVLETEANDPPQEIKKLIRSSP